MYFSNWNPGKVVLTLSILMVCIFAAIHSHKNGLADANMASTTSEVIPAPIYMDLEPNMEMQVPNGEVCPDFTLEIPVISRILGLDSTVWTDQCGWPHSLGYAQLTYEFVYTFNAAVIFDSSVTTTPVNYVKNVTVNSDLVNVYNNPGNVLDLGDGFGIYFDDTDWDCSTDLNCPSVLPDDSIYTNASYYPTWSECETSDPKRPDISGEWQPNWKFVLTYDLDTSNFSGYAGGSIDFTNSSEYGFLVFSGYGSYLSPAIIPGYCFPCGELAVGTVRGGDYYAGTTINDPLSISTCAWRLPLRLNDFDLEVIDTEVHLDWSIFKDGPNISMELQRSVNGIKFETINEYDVTELLTDAEYAFNFVDRNAAVGSNYYRIKMTDIDGFEDYSEVLHGYIYQGSKGEDDILVYPNPAGDFVRIGNLPSSGSLRVFDTAGRLLRTLELNGSDIEVIETSEWASGLYSVQVSSPSDRFTTNFIKQ